MFFYFSNEKDISMCIIDNSIAKPRGNGRWLKFRFSSSGNHEGWWHRRGGAAATAEVEFAGRREVTRDHRPLCVITNRPARTVLFNRTKVQEVSSYPPPYSTCLSFFLFDPPNARRKKKRRGRTWPSEKTRIQQGCPNIWESKWYLSVRWAAAK